MLSTRVADARMDLKERVGRSGKVTQQPAFYVGEVDLEE